MSVEKAYQRKLLPKLQVCRTSHLKWLEADSVTSLLDVKGKMFCEVMRGTYTVLFVVELSHTIRFWGRSDIEFLRKSQIRGKNRLEQWFLNLQGNLLWDLGVKRKIVWKFVLSWFSVTVISNFCFIKTKLYMSDRFSIG